MPTPDNGPDAPRFSPEILKEYRRFRRSAWNHLRHTNILVIISSPLIYACVIPFLLLDLGVSLYQAVCFPIYGIPKVDRKEYIVYDRGRLGYLNVIEKLGCAYCSYANGFIAYVTEIAARTEQHFCPIRHAHRVANPHSRYDRFLPYGDAQAYRARSEQVSQDYSDLVRTITPAPDSLKR